MAEYDPNKKYRWNPGDKFEITGEQFGNILNAFRAVLSSPEAQRILFIQQANNAVEDIMAKGVESDIIKEIEETPI
jgi:hypothetical protein